MPVAVASYRRRAGKRRLELQRRMRVLAMLRARGQTAAKLRRLDPKAQGGSRLGGAIGGTRTLRRRADNDLSHAALLSSR